MNEEEPTGKAIMVCMRVADMLVPFAEGSVQEECDRCGVAIWMDSNKTVIPDHAKALPAEHICGLCVRPEERKRMLLGVIEQLTEKAPEIREAIAKYRDAREQAQRSN